MIMISHPAGTSNCKRPCGTISTLPVALSTLIVEELDVRDEFTVEHVSHGVSVLSLMKQCVQAGSLMHLYHLLRVSSRYDSK